MRDLQLAFINNQITKRLFRILSIMERDRVFTINEISNRLEVTQRTIANDLNHIRVYFGDSIALESGYNGFLFEEIKPSLYQERKQGLLEGEYLFEIIGNIFKGKQSNIDELAHQYHFSESTFRRLLDQSTPILLSYELIWASNPLGIRGSEANLRKFFKDFFYEGIDTSYTLVPDSKLHDLVINKLSKEVEMYEIGSGTTPAAFYYTFYITIMRARLGYSIEIPEHLVQLIYKEKSFSFFYSLQSDIEKMFQVVLSKEEFAWVYLVTLCKRTIDQEPLEDNFYQRFHTGHEIALLVDDYLEEYGFKREYSEIRTFLRSFFLSRQINHSIAPALNKEAKDVKEALIHSDNENYRQNLQF
ncbi:helix-turn-helix domain-containing protein [Enterococcus casseliflavus]|uniref:helix-turn-helix domain-containing protein n=1 Tax=Enterococcus casseliflavus TaxID=37734 RepID=UPI002DBF967B|nr:helix-turn-helix domain-containing protein [Enterococcus casseliflavus]MEB8401552.1 helix-turn-helix domain-containing protein [Enterococcus casseliflavus]